MDKKAESSSMTKKVGKSLRRKKGGGTAVKPIIGPPRQIPMPPMPGAKLPTTTAPPEVATRDKQKVADLMKRRMSGRFLTPGETNVGDIPAIPALPNLAQLPASVRRAQPEGKQPQDLEVDLDAFRNPSFEPEQYVQQFLANATDSEIREFQERLKDRRKRTSTDLQHNVFVNRTQFILISKEIDKLKSEMRTLRGLLNDLHNTTSSLKVETDSMGAIGLSSSFTALNSQSGPVISKSRKAANRSSIADLTVLHMLNLQGLWKQVEGAQKFLPAVPGRHILMESGDWLELNAATWKPRRHVHMVLLNDHLLMAAKKRKRIDPNNPQASKSGGPMVKLVAERCWPLGEIELVDLSPTNEKSGRLDESMSNAINIRVGKESFVFRNEDQETKVRFLLTFKKTVEELRKAIRAESEDKHRIRDSLLTYHLSSGGDVSSSLLTTITRDQPPILVHFDGQPRDLRWVENQLDDLDELIAHRRFDPAVSLTEKLRVLASSALKSNLLAQDIVTLKVDSRVASLAALLLEELSTATNHAAHKSVVRRTVSWLIRLDYEDRARTTFLDTRAATIRSRARMVRFDGHIPTYLSHVALVTFTLIRNSVDVYNSCFEARVASVMVRWAKEHVQQFVELYHRQLEGVARDDPIRKECEQMVLTHAAMLTEVGLDLFRGGQFLEVPSGDDTFGTPLNV